jgi:arylsulfatase A-like enzyme
MKPRFILNSFGCALILIAIFGGLPALVSPVRADASDKGRRNVLFITCDQRMFQTVRAKGFRQPALDRLAARGVTFTNHYIASAVCTPSRGVIYSGRAPQVTGIQEEMMFGWTPSLPTNAVSMGTAMKRLGYRTAYFGKFELDRDIVFPKPGVNYADALKKYGFDVWQPYGEVTGSRTRDTRWTASSARRGSVGCARTPSACERRVSRGSSSSPSSTRTTSSSPT